MNLEKVTIRGWELRPKVTLEVENVWSQAPEGAGRMRAGGGVAYGPWDELGLRDAGLEVPKSHISVQSSGIWGAL